jgi:CHAT domain-containing protein/tetratricopeptide (TPR) repeat protein
MHGCRGRLESRRPQDRYQEALLKFQHGDLIGSYRESDEAYRNLATRDPEWGWRFRVLEAEILVWRGLSRDALQLLEPQPPPTLAYRDIAVRREVVEGLADCSLQELDEATKHLSNAQQLAESYETGLLGEVILGRGNLFVARSDYPAAEEAYRQSLEFARDKNQTFLRLKALGSLGLISMQQEHYDESIDWDTEALNLARSLDAQIVVEKVLGNEGWNYYKMGDLESARSLLQQAKQAAHDLGGLKDETIWIRNIATVEIAQRDYSAAERDYQEALRLASQMENKAVAVVCLYSLANVKLYEGRNGEAEAYNREANDMARAGHDHTSELYALITGGYIAAANNNFPLGEADFRSVLADKDADSYLRWEAEVGLTDLYADADRPAEADAYFRKEIMTLSASRASFKREESRMSFLSSAISSYEEYIRFLTSQHREQEALQVAEVSRAQALVEGLGLGSSTISFPIKEFNPQRTSSQLNSLIFSYWIGGVHSYLWVITPTRLTLFTLPPAAEIDPLVQSYRQALLGSRDVLETQNAAGRKLYDLLVAPAAKMIPKGTRVTILPDGSLYGLNFETLLAPSPQLHYWIEDVDVSYANSLTLLAAGASRRPALAKKLLLVGDPVSPDAEFPKLPQAAAEMAGIENYFPAAERTVFSGAGATPDSYLKSEPSGFSNIHFVAHGTASRTSPLDSAVILSRQGDEYKLYARDIIQHPLHADLVTISACHGEGVRAYSGEGLVGLSWAFLRAGAHGVIAALWEVNDNSTPQLMDHLYSEIGKGAAPDAALRDAKLALLHSGGVYRRPFYWAPFELYRGS